MQLNALDGHGRCCRSGSLVAVLLFWRAPLHFAAAVVCHGSPHAPEGIAMQRPFACVLP